MIPSTIRTPLIAAALAAGCAHKAQVKPAVAPTPTRAPTATAPPAAAPATPAPATTTDLRVSSQLVAQCQLDVGHTDHAPKFDFDQFDLLPEDRDVLQQVAECLTQGPLKNRSLELVGRADPRGTEEYNLGLGTRRAHTVATYLELLGVRNTQLAETTRGALDAHGTDEPGWKIDRRVDLDLHD